MTVKTSSYRRSARLRRLMTLGSADEGGEEEESGVVP
jgi:hypothetical protein